MINSSRAKDSLTSGRPMLLRSLIRPKYVTVRASALARSGPWEGDPERDGQLPSSVAHRGETAYAPARWLGSVFASTSKLRRSQPKDDKCPNGSALSCGPMDTGRKGGF